MSGGPRRCRAVVSGSRCERFGAFVFGGPVSLRENRESTNATRSTARDSNFVRMKLYRNPHTKLPGVGVQIIHSRSDEDLGRPCPKPDLECSRSDRIACV